MKNFSGTPLCEAHFKEQFERRFSSTVREFSMMGPREHIGVAVSGGKDSLVMLRLLAKLRQRRPIKLTAILVDEGIAGYRNQTIPAARAECRRLGVPLHITSFKKEFGASLDEMLEKRQKQKWGGGSGGTSNWGQTSASAADGAPSAFGRRAGGRPPSAVRFGACTYCGVFRRTLLNRAAAKLKVDKLAMGHNLDDAAQTVLMNLMRNEPARLSRFGPGALERTQSGGRGKKAKPRWAPRIQPLIRAPEKEVALYALLSGIDIHFMSCPNAEEAMRQQVRRLLNEMEERYPGTKARTFNAFLQMQPSLLAGARGAEDGAEAESGMPPAGAGTCVSCGEMTSGDWCAACKLLGQLGLNSKN